MNWRIIVMKERIREIIFEYFGDMFPEKRLEFNENFVEYGFNSYTLVELLIQVEETFCVELNDEFLLAENINTVEKLENAINSSNKG